MFRKNFNVLLPSQKLGQFFLFRSKFISISSIEISDKLKLNFFTRFTEFNLYSFSRFSMSQAVGKFIDASGITKMMIDSGLIAEGSMKGLITGTHFNRCKKLHVAAALSFKKLHFNAFFEKYNESTRPEKLNEEEIVDILTADSKNPNNDNLLLLEDVLRKYEIFTEKTLEGEHGNTPKYIMMYVRFIDYYLMFVRAIRTTDLDLIIYALFRMAALFFAFNHHNYARWSTRYLDELMNIDENYPGLRNEFNNGALSIRRTTANFCRTPVDITLEQTINANAANKLTGITLLTNSIYARQRWSETHVIRTAIITNLLDKLRLNKHNNSESSWKSKLFDRQQQKFTEEIIKNINPFNECIDPSKLFNITSGKSASIETTEFLVNVEKNGMQQMQNFITESKISERFSKPLKRNIIQNFAAETSKSKKSQKKQIDSMRIERNVLARSLCIAMKNKVDLRSILSYSLADVPHSFAHFEDSLQPKVQTGELIQLLFTGNNVEGNDANNLPKFDVEIIDGFYLLNRLHESPSKYGQFAIHLFRQICHTEAREIHVLFDKHESPSIRDMHVAIRKELYGESSEYKIKGPNQERTGGLRKCLNNDNFTEELVAFLIEYWTQTKQELLSCLKSKRVFISYGNECHLFFDNENVEFGQQSLTYANNHIEIETRIIMHIQKIRANNILVRTYNCDTTLVYLLYHMQFWNKEKEIFIETCSSLINTNDTKRMNVRKSMNLHSSELINALPAWYAFTGCYYEPSFYRKGRKSCFKVLRDSTEFQRAFSRLGFGMKITEGNNQTIEQYACKLYGSKCCTINEARDRNRRLNSIRKVKRALQILYQNVI